MPRTARRYSVGAPLHVISRFVNDEFRLVDRHDRSHLLSAVPRAARGSDVKPLGYAWMSSHLHWSIQAGEMLISPFFASVNTSLAAQLNRRQGRTGPVFANRFKCIEIEAESIAGLLAYHHNNPCRAGIVADPSDSDWTSHRAYLREVEPPPWLDVSLGLHLCGFNDTPSGRLAFHELVLSRKDEPRDPAWSTPKVEHSVSRPEVEVGRGAGHGISELVSAEREARRGDHAAGRRRMHAPWRGAPDAALALVAANTGLPVEVLRSRDRRTEVVEGRRLALRLWTEHLGRPAVQMARELGLAPSTASSLLRYRLDRAERLDGEAEGLSVLLRRGGALDAA